MKVKIIHYYEPEGNRSEIYEVDGWDEAGKIAYIIESCGCAVVSMKGVIVSTPPTQTKEDTQTMLRLYDNEMIKRNLQAKGY